VTTFPDAAVGHLGDGNIGGIHLFDRRHHLSDLDGIENDRVRLVADGVVDQLGLLDDIVR
jgi:hypothetical protein